MKFYHVYTCSDYGAEKFYIDFEGENVCFLASSVDDAIEKGKNFIRLHSIFGYFTAEKWIDSQIWGATEVCI